MSVDVDEVLKDTCWNSFVFEGRIQKSLNFYPLNHKNRQYTLFDMNSLTLTSQSKMISFVGFSPTLETFNIQDPFHPFFVAEAGGTSAWKPAKELGYPPPGSELYFRLSVFCPAVCLRLHLSLEECAR